MNDVPGLADTLSALRPSYAVSMILVFALRWLGWGPVWALVFSVSEHFCALSQFNEGVKLARARVAYGGQFRSLDRLLAFHLLRERRMRSRGHDRARAS